MNIAGLVAMLICFIGASAIIVCNKYIKKVTNCYFFWLGISIAILIYFITCRFAGSWHEYAQALDSGVLPDGSTHKGADMISRALLFDFCPFFGLLTPILLIVDPSRKAARSVAPILLVGTLFTCTAGFLGADPSHVNFDPYIFFHGDKGWELYIGLHLVNLWLAVGILCNTPKFHLEGYLIMMGFIAFFIFYVLLLKTITGCQQSTSGLSYYDWWILDGEKGTYYKLTEIFGNNPYAAMGFTWPMEILLFSGVVAMSDLVFKRYKWHAFGNARNNKKVVWHIKGKNVKVKQWWFWYDYDKFVEPKRSHWFFIAKASKFFTLKNKF